MLIRLLPAASDSAVPRYDIKHEPGDSHPRCSTAFTDRTATVSKSLVNGFIGAYPSTTASMALQQQNHHRELEEYVQETLGPHREVLEALSELDTELSDDAEDALAILDDLEAQE